MPTDRRPWRVEAQGKLLLGLVRVEREDDGTLRAYGSEAYADDYTLLVRGPVKEIVGRFDVSGGLRRWLERQPGASSV